MLVEAARTFASLATHRREVGGLGETRKRFETNLQLFLAQLKECQARFSYVSDFLVAVDFNEYY